MLAATMPPFHRPSKWPVGLVVLGGLLGAIPLVILISGGHPPGLLLPGGAVLLLAGAVARWELQNREQFRRDRQELSSRLEGEIAQRKTGEALLEVAGRIARLGHWEQARDGRDPWWSEVTYEIHDLPPGSPVSRDQSMEFIHPDDRAAMLRSVREAMTTGRVFNLEARVITAKGRLIWVLIRGEPVPDSAGEVHSMRGVIQDIDERRRFAEMLEKKNFELQEATARAEAHSRAKEEFLANMSHEIRTPLNAIIGMSDLLGDSSMGVREREFVETIHNSGEVLLGLINDILDFSKIESGQLDLEEIPMHVRDCVESALDLLAGPAAKKRLDLMYGMDPEVPASITGDPTRLRQVLVNLLSNAIKFTHQGEVLVKLSLRSNAAGEAMLYTAVQDTGIGIPADRMDRLFQAFSQLDSSTTRRYGGTGLGLAISQRLIEKMGGRLWVDSHVPAGSSFQFEIPLRPASLPGALADAFACPALAGKRIIIVDGNATHSGILRNQLESWGMLAVVDGPPEALARIAGGERFDLAILDVRMSESHSYTLAAAIRSHRSEAELPLLVLACVGDRDMDLRSLGISGALTKPLKIGVLFSALRTVLEAAPSGGTLVTVGRSGRKLAEKCPLRILLAEDNLVNQRVAALLLQRAGYRCSVVANGLEVLEAIRRTDFDVILMDVQMPEMDGLQAARSLCRSYPQGIRPWMIALTANAVDGDREDCLAAGMDDYLSKPIRSESLEAALEHAHGQRVSAAIGETLDFPRTISRTTGSD